MYITVEKVMVGCFPIEAFRMHRLLHAKTYFVVISLKKKEKKLKPKTRQLKFRPVTLFSHLTGRRTVIGIIKTDLD